MRRSRSRQRLAEDAGLGGWVLPVAVVALVVLIAVVAMPPKMPPGVSPLNLAAAPSPGGPKLHTLAPSMGHSPVPSNYSLDVAIYRLVDKFGLVDSGLSDDGLREFIARIKSTWLDAGINVRINEVEALKPVQLNEERALAYLFYVYGHPRIPPNDRRSQILGLAKSTAWIVRHYRDFVDAALDPVDQFTRNTRLLAEISPPVFRPDFISLANKFNLAKPEVVFESLAGSAPDAKITAQAVDEAMSASNKPTQLREVHLAFRKFYLDRGLAPDKVVNYSAALKSKPQLFLNFALGRDVSLTVHDSQRSPWEKQNVLAIYPVRYFGEGNSRGSTTWMDVVLRTASCFQARNLTGTSIPVRCRWGVRAGEKRQPTVPELARAAAKDLGSCLGLTVPSKKCLVVPSAHVAPLMQPERSIALQTWVDEKACVPCATCIDCLCRFSDAMAAQVANFTAVSSTEAMRVRNAVASRDVAESRSVPGTSTLGPKLNEADNEQRTVWLSLRAEEAVSVGPRIATPGRVRRVRLRALALPRREISVVVRVFRAPHLCSSEGGKVVAENAAHVDGRMSAHWEIDVDLAVEVGDVVEVAVAPATSELVNVLALKGGIGHGCLVDAAGERRAPKEVLTVLGNYDLARG